MASNHPADGQPLPATDVFETIGQQAAKVDGPAAQETQNGDDERVVEEIESLCMNCHENGITRIFLTSIPYFREIVIMSFHCDKCGHQSNEVQPASSIQPKGAHYELRLRESADLSRTVIKSDTSVFKFIELDVEIPPGRGQLTNVEGLLANVVQDLENNQEQRKEQQPEVYEKIKDIISKGRAMLEGKSFPFRVTIDDPAGNSFIVPDLKDGVGKWEKREYIRTPEQNTELGLAATEDTEAPSSRPGQLLTDDGEIIPNEVYDFPASCPGCMHPCVTHMKMVDIPHFKQVVLMSTVCDACGYRSNDVKTGGEVPEKGERITLEVRTAADLGRDILKSESCALSCPELSLEINPGTLGGRFTTVEGLFTQVRDDLHNQIFETHGRGTGAPNSGVHHEPGTDDTSGGDSFDDSERSRWISFFENLDAAIRGEQPFTVVLTDPLASSYVQPLVDPPAVDPQITRENYDRTEEEEEDLGLKDIKVEGYQEEEEGAVQAATEPQTNGGDGEPKTGT